MEKFSASMASRLISCSASGDLEHAIPGWTPPIVDDTAGAKGKGTDIHATLQEVVENYSLKDMRMITQSLEYVSLLRERRRFKVLTEDKRQVQWLVSKPNSTVDLVLYTRDELHIVDYKTGAIRVEVQNNEQLMYYALNYAELAPNAKGVHLHIVQPWANNMSEWFADTATLAAFKAKALAAEQRLLDGDLTFQPSDHCTFCPANPQSRGDKGTPLCPAMMQLLYPSKVDEEAILNEL